MDRQARLVRASRAAIFLTSFALLAASPQAATFQVVNTLDGIPAPPGSLRAAIEASEGNGEPDVIVFAGIGGTIDLVAPLPDLLEGGLQINKRSGSDTTPPAGNPVAIRGANGVSRAIAVRSPGNVIAELDFVDFSGSEAILIAGGRARDNEVARCVFGGDLGGSNSGAGIRILALATDPSFPTGTKITGSRFARNGTGVLLEGMNDTSTPPLPVTRIAGSWFGTDAHGGPGAGNGESLRGDGCGSVLVHDCRFSGPGTGIHLGPGADGSELLGSDVGVLGTSSDVCSGFSGPAVVIDRSAGVEIRGNRIRCSQSGLVLGLGSEKSEVLDNEIGGRSPSGHLGDGVVLELAGSTLLRKNTVLGNGGFGITVGPGPSVDPPDALLACNAFHRNGAGAIGFTGFPPAPPAITSATVVAVQGTVQNVAPGWVEVFGDEQDEAAVFQGAVRLDQDVDPSFRHRLPVLALTLSKTADGSVISFDRHVPARHTATVSDRTLHRTSRLSPAVPASTSGLVFDVIRGDLSNLAFGATGGIDLGPVVCLAAAMDPDPAVSPDPVDPEVPLPKQGFFYLTRRRDLESNVAGTYDPAICLTDVDAFAGPRTPSSGDCR